MKMILDRHFTEKHVEYFAQYMSIQNEDVVPPGLRITFGQRKV